MRLKGRTAILTGAAGGLGQAIAARFFAEGAGIVLVDRLDVTAMADAATKAGHKALAVQAELTDSRAIAAMVSAAQAQFGRIDILVHLAGVGSHGALDDVTEEEWTRVLNANLTSVFLCCKAVVPVMRAQGHGRIINIGSIIAKNGGNPRPWIDKTEQKRASNLAYGASKAGVHALTLFLAKETAAEGITVNAVAPGPIASNPRVANLPESLKAQIPVGRLGRPEEVADAVAFLAGDDAAFITGEILDVNGGLWVD